MFFGELKKIMKMFQTKSYVFLNTILNVKKKKSQFEKLTYNVTFLEGKLEKITKIKRKHSLLITQKLIF